MTGDRTIAAEDETEGACAADGVVELPLVGRHCQYHLFWRRQLCAKGQQVHAESELVGQLPPGQVRPPH